MIGMEMDGVKDKESIKRKMFELKKTKEKKN